MTLEVLGPIDITRACGHRETLDYLATTQEHVDSLIDSPCLSCRYEEDRFLSEGSQEVEQDTLPALDPFEASEGPPEPTHLHCADCNRLIAIEDLALQLDDRRTCEACSERAELLAKLKRELEDLGQERLF